MGLFLFLTVIQAIIAATMIGVVLMQRSEGGGLGIGSGGSPGGLMSARGAADFLTRTTKWLAVLFVVLAIVLAAMAVDVTSGAEIDQTLDRTVTQPQQGTALPDPLAPALAPTPQAPGAPAQADPLVPGDQGLDGEPPVNPVPAQSDDPLAGVAG